MFIFVAYLTNLEVLIFKIHKKSNFFCVKYDL